MIKLNKSKLMDLYKDMRGTFSIEDLNEIALKAMALVILNVTSLLKTKEDILKAIENAEREYPQAFTDGSRNVLSHLTEDTIFDLIYDLSENQQKGLFTPENKFEWVQYIFNLMNGTKYGYFAFDDSIYDFCNKLYSNVNHDEIYIPFENSFYHTLMFSQEQSVASEGVKTTPIPAILNIILGGIQYKQSDAITNPAYIKDGKLRLFSKGFLAEPWGMKVNINDQDNQRFSVKSNNLQNYLIQHLFQQVNDFAIVIMPINGLHSSVQSEELMRQWLLEQGHLKAVISLPSGLSISTMTNSALLIFDFSTKYETVNFISLKDSEFVEKRNRETKLTQLDKLIDIIDSNLAHKSSKKVDVKTILNNSYILNPERYVLDNSTQDALNILQEYETKKLGDLVDIYRPIPVSKLKSDGSEMIFEIQGGDIPEFGYIDTASKENCIDNELMNILSPHLLQENDIIITVRGSSGKVGIVSKELLNKYQGKVIIGQANLILRVKDTQNVNAIALLMQLRSELSQSRLQVLSSGAVLSGLSVKDLKEFLVANFSLEKQKKLEENFQKQEIIKQQIIQQKQQMQFLANDFWN